MKHQNHSKNISSNTGTVHSVKTRILKFQGGATETILVPFCGGARTRFSQSIVNYSETDEPVTCGKCLARKAKLEKMTKKENKV